MFQDVVSVGINSFFCGEGCFLFLFLDVLEDFFLFDCFWTFIYELNVLDSELEEYQLCFVDRDEVLEVLESDDVGSEGSKGDFNKWVVFNTGVCGSCGGDSDCVLWMVCIPVVLNRISSAFLGSMA